MRAKPSISSGSASAAEIVAAALHDNGRALLIGQKTFGKGTVQETRTLADTSELHITVAQWLTPRGYQIQGQGLQPDVEVAPPTSADGDPTLAAAVEYLSQTGAAARG